MRGPFRHWLLLLALLALFAAFMLWPIAQIVRVGFQGIPTDGHYGAFTLAYIAAVFKDPQLRRGLINSAAIAIAVTALCTLLSLPLALLTRRYDFRGKSLVNGLLLVPLVLPPFVGAIGMRQILGRFGALTALIEHMGLIAPNAPVDWLGAAPLPGIILVEALALYPILYLNLTAALANLDPAMEQAAANLGASRWRILRTITLPLVRPGLFAGGTIVLIWSFTDLGTPLMFNYTDVTPVQIWHQINQVSGNPIPYALVVVMLLASATLYVIGRLLLGRGHEVAVTKAATTAVVAEPLGLLRSIPILLPFVLVISLALLPHVGVILTSISGVGAWYRSVLPQTLTARHYVNALTYDVTLASMRNSVMFASLSVLLDIALGLAVAYLIVRSHLPGRRMIDALAMLPLAVPGLVLAFGYLAISLQLQAWFKNAHWLREMVDVTENPTLLLVIAYAMRRLPYVVRSAVAGLQQTPVDLELAARNLGASSAATLRRITVPLISANLIAGALLAFAFAMLEVSDSLILAQKETYWPITRAIYELFQRLGDGPYIASALGVWAMVLLALTILSANSLLGRRLGAAFRV
ncbi:MAG TPA: iron ABC transporter permease [Tepidisphaeraceae bacterium]|nr:iron ABC transporter permease [Tepidisphaeraceae bacterium]